MTQKQLAALAEMAQPRISAMERPGATKFNIETLVRLASAFKVGLKVEFVPFSEMLDWENSFSQDQFDPVPIDNDRQFLNPAIAIQVQPAASVLTANRANALARMGIFPLRTLLKPSETMLRPINTGVIMETTGKVPFGVASGIVLGGWCGNVKDIESVWYPLNTEPVAASGTPVEKDVWKAEYQNMPTVNAAATGYSA